MKIRPKQYAQALYELALNKDKSDVKQMLNDFFGALVSNNDIDKADKIIFEFNKLWNRENGFIDVEVRSVNEIGNDIKKEIVEYLKKRTGAKDVRINAVLDENILGGAVIKYEDKVIDGSLRTKLILLREEMQK